MTQNTNVIDSRLVNLAVGVPMGNDPADTIVPRVDTLETTYRYLVRGDADKMRDQDSGNLEVTDYDDVSIGYRQSSERSVALKGYGHAERWSRDEQLRHDRANTGIDLRANAVVDAVAVLRRAKNKRVAALLKDTTNSVETSAAANLWTSANGDPIGDLTGIIRDSNWDYDTLVIGKDILAILAANEKVNTMAFGSISARGVLMESDIARLLPGVQRVIVGNVIANTATETDPATTPSYTNYYAGIVALINTTNFGTAERPSGIWALAPTMRQENGAPVALTEYDDPSKGSGAGVMFIKAGENTVEHVVNKEAGHLLTGVKA